MFQKICIFSVELEAKQGILISVLCICIDLMSLLYTECFCNTSRFFVVLFNTIMCAMLNLM